MSVYVHSIKDNNSQQTASCVGMVSPHRRWGADATVVRSTLTILMMAAMTSCDPVIPTSTDPPDSSAPATPLVQTLEAFCASISDYLEKLIIISWMQFAVSVVSGIGCLAGLLVIYGRRMDLRSLPMRIIAGVLASNAIFSFASMFPRHLVGSTQSRCWLSHIHRFAPRLPPPLSVCVCGWVGGCH